MMSNCAFCINNLFAGRLTNVTKSMLYTNLTCPTVEQKLIETIPSLAFARRSKTRKQQRSAIDYELCRRSWQSQRVAISCKPDRRRDRTMQPKIRLPFSTRCVLNQSLVKQVRSRAGSKMSATVRNQVYNLNGPAPLEFAGSVHEKKQWQTVSPQRRRAMIFEWGDVCRVAELPHTVIEDVPQTAFGVCRCGYVSTRFTAAILVTLLDCLAKTPSERTPLVCPKSFRATVSVREGVESFICRLYRAESHGSCDHSDDATRPVNKFSNVSAVGVQALNHPNSIVRN